MVECTLQDLTREFRVTLDGFAEALSNGWDAECFGAYCDSLEDVCGRYEAVTIVVNVAFQQSAT